MPVHIFGSAANGLGIRDNNDIDVSMSLPLPENSREEKGARVRVTAVKGTNHYVWEV